MAKKSYFTKTRKSKKCSPIREINQCSHIDRSNLRVFPILDELDSDLRDDTENTNAIRTAIVERKKKVSTKNRSLHLQNRNHSKTLVHRMNRQLRRFFHRLFQTKRRGERVHLSYSELKETLSNVIEYHNMVGNSLHILMEELQKRSSSKT